MTTLAELKEDLAFLGQLADATGLRSARQSVDRIAVVIGDQEHLLKAAKLLRSDQCVFLDGWIEHHDWLAADKARGT